MLKELTTLINELQQKQMNCIPEVLFILWEEIYKMNSERKQDFQLAKKTYNMIKDTYEYLV